MAYTRIIPVALIAISILIQPSCKKAGEAESGIVTFKVGSVTAARDGAQPVELKLADRVATGTVIETGEKSACAVQFGESCVVRIDEGSRFLIVQAGAKELALSLRSGSVMSKLVRSGNRTLAISTPTALAAVRGTRFSVSYREGRSVVAVNEGTVQVAAERHDESGKAVSAAAQEAPVKEGSTAVVAEAPKKAGEERPALELTQRPISDTENKSLKKIEVLPIVPDAASKKAEDLEKNQPSIIEKEQEIDKTINKGVDEDEVRKMMARKDLTLAEIRRTFNRIDEITLYSGKVIKGAILSRGASYSVLTPEGTISIPERNVQNVKVIR